MPLQHVKRIIVIGDSITQQGETPGGYVWLVRHNLEAIYPAAKIELLNAGISGNKSTDMLARFDRDVVERHPDLVLISVGVNDVWHGFYDNHTKGDGPLGIPVEAYRANVKAMISKARNAGAKATLMLTTPIGEDLSGAENTKAIGYNQALSQTASESNSGLIDLHSPFASLIGSYRAQTHSTQNFLTVDGVHMNSQGNQVMAQTILSALGVPDADRVRVSQSILDQIKNSKPHPGPLPVGQVLSYDKPCASSSNFSAEFGPNQPVLSGKRFEQRWCAGNGDFEPNPWWTVDLGASHSLSGIHIEFAPEEPDTWRYKVQGSVDGSHFFDLTEASKEGNYFYQENHSFTGAPAARYVRILFTGDTRAQNWASLRFVQVFGK